MSTTYRCSRCQTRHTLGTDQLAHGRTPLCKKCGHNHFYKVRGERTCHCDAYHHHHRAGSGGCDSVALERAATEESLKLYYHSH